MNWWPKVNLFASFVRFAQRTLSWGLNAESRGVRLLKENLSPAQREQFVRHKYFDVIGGQTGKRYRIRRGFSMNIDELDETGNPVVGWCFFPSRYLVVGDVMLAQKLALELFEAEALAVANSNTREWHRIRRIRQRAVAERCH